MREIRVVVAARQPFGLNEQAGASVGTMEISLPAAWRAVVDFHCHGDVDVREMGGEIIQGKIPHYAGLGRRGFMVLLRAERDQQTAAAADEHLFVIPVRSDIGTNIYDPSPWAPIDYAAIDDDDLPQVNAWMMRSDASKNRSPAHATLLSGLRGNYLFSSRTESGVFVNFDEALGMPPAGEFRY